MKKETCKPLTRARLKELKSLAALPDEAIDTSDAPEVFDWSCSKRGLFYRPVKQQLTLRIDADVVAWFKIRTAAAPSGLMPAACSPHEPSDIAVGWASFHMRLPRYEWGPFNYVFTYLCQYCYIIPASTELVTTWGCGVKLLGWVGTAKEDLLAFPDEVVQEIGTRSMLPRLAESTHRRNR